jgi:hypothetical protein
MAADGKLLQGEVTEQPEAGAKDAERLLVGFLEALLAESGAGTGAGK